MSVCSIYRITHRDSGKCYIGFTSQATKRRWTEHKRDSANSQSEKHQYLHRAMKKHGIDSFDFDVIYQSKDRDHTLKVMESFFIGEYDSMKNGYNLTLGGEGVFGYIATPEHRAKLSAAGRNRKHSDETKAKIASASSGRNHSEETKAKVGAAGRGRRHTDAARNKMSASRMGKRLSDSAREKLHAYLIENPPMKGRKHSEETKTKMSDAHRGRKFSDEHRAKIGDALRGRKRGPTGVSNWHVTHPDGSEETITNMADFCRKHELGDQSGMSAVANGRKTHHKGYRCIKLPSDQTVH